MDLTRLAPLDCRLSIQCVAQLRAQLGHVHAGLGQQAAHRASVLLEQGHHQVNRLDELMVAAHRQRLSVRYGELKLTR